MQSLLWASITQGDTPNSGEVDDYGSKSHTPWQMNSVTAQWKMPAHSHSGLALEKVKGLHIT